MPQPIPVAVFRADASQKIGSGHVMRCLTLANLLREEGWATYFICRDHPGQMSDTLKAAGHVVHLLDHQQSTENDLKTQPGYSHWLGSSQADDADETIKFLKDLHPDWVVADHYALDYEWERAVAPYCNHLMVIDDLANRKHHCDLILDQTHGRTPADYSALVPNEARILCGATYALLRPDFAAMRETSLRNKTRETVSHILISMGGSDPDNITQDILRILSDFPLPEECKVTVVVGAQSQYFDSLNEFARTLPFPCEILYNVSDMAALMASCDLAIGAAGSTSWERCCMGLPTIMIVLADNQKLVAQKLENSGAAFVLETPDVIESEISQYINVLLSDPHLRKTMSMRSSLIVDGLGSEKVAFAMDEINAG